MSRDRSCGLPGRRGACLIVAELGLNHGGRPADALSLMQAAAQAGAGAVKVQTYRTDDFCQPSDRWYETLKRCEIWPYLGRLKQEADRLGLPLFGTPTTPEGVRELVALGAPWLKNGSDALGHDGLLQAMARTGRPTVISVGMATRAEIGHAVEVFQQAGRPTPLTICLCVSSYPTAERDAHLSRLSALAQWGCPVGWSSHLRGYLDAVVAVSLGACYIEKHFKRPGARGPEARWSLSPAEFARMVGAIRSTERLLGRGGLGYVPCEEKGRAAWRWTDQSKRQGAA